MVDVRWPLTAATVMRTPTSDRPHDPVFSLRIGDLGSTAAKEFVGPSIPTATAAAYGQGAIEGTWTASAASLLPGRRAGG